MDKKETKKSLFKKTSDIVLTVIISIIGLIAALTIVEKAIGRTITGYNVVWVRTDSMEPTIKQRSYILTKNIDGNDVKEDDIVTFVVNDSSSPINGQYNTHRVIEISPTNELITQGDNNLGQDAHWVNRADVKAIYIKSLPLLTIFGRFFASIYGLIATLLIVSSVIGIWIYLTIKDKKKTEKDEEMQRLIKEEVARLEAEAKEKENA